MKRILAILLFAACSAVADETPCPPYTPAELTRAEADEVLANAIKQFQVSKLRNLIELAQIRPEAELIAEAEAAQVALRIERGTPPPSEEELEAIRVKVRADRAAQIDSITKMNAECDRKIAAIRAARDAGKIIAPQN